MREGRGVGTRACAGEEGVFEANRPFICVAAGDLSALAPVLGKLPDPSVTAGWLCLGNKKPSNLWVLAQATLISYSFCDSGLQCPSLGPLIHRTVTVWNTASHCGWGRKKIICWLLKLPLRSDTVHLCSHLLAKALKQVTWPWVTSREGESRKWSCHVP